MFSSSKLNRKYPRVQVNASLRLYSSITRGKYSAELDNLSRKGAFVKSRHFPAQNEIISFYLVDRHNEETYCGNARVVWFKEQGSIENIGFGLEFENEINSEYMDSLSK